MENADKSFFEQLPGEIRDLIYRWCLKHDENTITPLPTDYERASLRKRGKKVPCKPYDAVVRQAPITAKITYQSYDPKWPAVALLGVNHSIHNEVLPILFGRNVWRLSCQYTWPLSHRISPLSQRPTILHEPYLYWVKYAEYFREVSCKFSAMDLSHGYLIRMFRKYLFILTNCSADLRDKRHNKHIQVLCDGPMADKIATINGMENLRLIHIRLSTLTCPGACCRTPVFERLIELWKPDMVPRLRRWGPSKAVIECVGPKSFKCFIQGQYGALGVDGLWSEQEAETILEQWWRPALKTHKFALIAQKPRGCSEQEVKEFFRGLVAGSIGSTVERE